MSESKVTVNQRSGVSILGLLGIVFVVLKLGGWTEVATWSWWWVLAPFWAGIALVVGFLLVAGIFALLVLIGAACIDAWNGHKRRRRIY